ncbi:MAG: glycerophosphoryl diester phosphodiesterase membrane domain-containing protein [Ruminococcus sp.]|nr:glycerophosphoryl diester phosphodiesterase membrane domain-containing protein [Ruminococcus sp.]
MLRESVRLLRRSWKSLLVLELLMQLMSLTMLMPLAGALIDGAIRLTGMRYLTKANLELLLRSFWTLPLLAVLVFLAAIYMLIQFTGVIACMDAARDGRKLTLSGLLWEILSGVRRFFAPGILSLLGLLMLLIPMVTVSAAGGVVSAIGVPDVLGSLLSDQNYVVPAYAGIALICLMLSMRWILGLPVFVCRRCSFRAARRQSRRWMQGNSVRVFFGMLAWCLLYAILLLGILILLTGAGISLISAFGGSVAYGKVPLRVLRYALLGVIFVFSAGAVPHFSAGMMAYYYRFRDEAESSCKSIFPRQQRLLRRTKGSVLAVLAVSALLTINISYLYRLVTGDASLRFVLHTEPVVVAHRGASASAPENTIYAFANAMELHAGGIELDVQQTADGVPVVTHDLNLKRISGWNRKVSEVTYEELHDLDVGSWFDPIYREARIMTLEEVLLFTGGEVFLNIELKSDAEGECLEEQVADLILQYGAESRCCVTSFSYASLKKIKEYCPDIRTGFIMSYAYGNFYDLEDADAFSIKSMFINQQVVSSAHQRGKEVYAWTVNSVPEMQRMLNLGVDHIITDKPELMQAQIDRDSTEDTLLEAVLRLTAS